MELRHLRYFEAVVKERNFTRAAESLGVAQPPLSRQIRELEHELGVQLFDRDSRPVRLTEAGRIFHDQAAQILSNVEQLRRSMERIGKASKRRYAIGFVASVVYGAMPDVVREFRDTAGDLDVELLEVTTLEQVAALKDGRIDAGIGRLQIDDPAIARSLLAQERLVLAVQTDHELARQDAVSLCDLTGHRLIVYPSQPRPSYIDQVLGMLRDERVYPQFLTEVRDVQIALGLVASAAGIALVPISMERVQRDDVRYLPVRENDAFSPIILSTRIADGSSETATLRQIAGRLYV